MILVTGATGLVGSHLLINLLQEAKEVKALYRNEKNIEALKNVFKNKDAIHLFEKIIWIKGDITDIPSLNNAFENVTHVYHCAALISFDPNDEELLRKTNIEGTANIVNCCIDFNVKKLCHVSSTAALGDPKETESIITEETEWNPEKLHGDYAISKYGAEIEVWRAHQEGLEIVIVNPGVIFGGGFPNQGSSILINKVKNGLLFYTKGKIGIIAVEDVVNCMTQLMNSSINGKKFCLVAENINLNDVLFIIAKGLKVKKPKFYAPKYLTSLAWRLDWFFTTITFKKRSFTRATAISSHSVDVYENTKIVNHLNYNFINMEEYLINLLLEYKQF
ncbi:NAD-dependent epimerase/dehydratase family protein [Flavobacterium sp.]|jgi:nucleoside-diphosphate-sugar epimerase|uniref:NAD-dependent epimerase/dehydratase family protein n=1 Tax=Flavobacterium sp. TaxID=239 RepID=UPI002A802600|nr:NAD-dependent epimerase/dehydratase family protein [Flavobacterium sp.]